MAHSGMRQRFAKGLLGGRVMMVLAVLALLTWLAGGGLPDGRLHVFFLDVGQGDAIFVQTPRGQQILIDGGPSPEALLEQLGTVMPFWDRSLDLLVLTHADADHISGLLPVLDRYRVGRVLDAEPPAAAGEPSLLAAWHAQLISTGVPRTAGLLGTRVTAGGIDLTVLHPATIAATTSASDDNDRSLVLRLDYGLNSFLLTGDAEEEAESEMLDAGLPLKADVLKTAHHGSRQSSSPRFLAAVAPALAVIQVGAGNHFGHPHAETLARLAAARVLRTDLQGRIEVSGDGQHLWVATDR